MRALTPILSVEIINLLSGRNEVTAREGIDTTPFSRKGERLPYVEMR